MENNRFLPALSPVIGVLLVVNILLYFVTQQEPGRWLPRFALWPLGLPEEYAALGVAFYPWQIITYGFLHANVPHIGFNLFALWMFGRPLEAIWGSARFLAYFLICMAGAGLVQLFVATLAVQQGNIYPTVGASGGVYGVLLAFAMMFPNQRILLLVPPIPMKAKYFVMVFAALELYFGVTGTQTGIAHFAHLGGMVFGFILIRWWKLNRIARLYSTDY